MKKGLNKKKFKLFMKYELRHSILNYLKYKDYEALNIFINGLSSLCKEHSLNSFERFAYKKRFLRLISIYIYIYITKVIWKSHGFPQTK